MFYISSVEFYFNRHMEHMEVWKEIFFEIKANLEKGSVLLNPEVAKVWVLDS